MQLFCHLGNGEMAEHSLDVHNEGCNPILHNNPSTWHIHGPNCGHERVLHGTHYDCLVRVQQPMALRRAIWSAKNCSVVVSCCCCEAAGHALSRTVAFVANCCLAIVNLHAALLYAIMLQGSLHYSFTGLTGWHGTRHTVQLHFLQVDNQLQHVPASECCAKRCMSAEAPLRTHGSLSVIRHRWAMARYCLIHNVNN